MSVSLLGGAVVYLVVFGVLLASYVAQLTLIFPLEAWLLPSPDLSHASLMFLPSGFKVVAAVLLGAGALLPIFAAQTLYGLLNGAPITEMMTGAAMGAMAVWLPVVLVNLLTERPLLGGLAEPGAMRLNLWRSFLLVSILAAIINSFEHTLYQLSQGNGLLHLRYLIGDLTGAFVAFGLLLLLRKRLTLRF